MMASYTWLRQQMAHKTSTVSQTKLGTNRPLRPSPKTNAFERPTWATKTGTWLTTRTNRSRRRWSRRSKKFKTCLVFTAPLASTRNSCWQKSHRGRWPSPWCQSSCLRASTSKRVKCRRLLSISERMRAKSWRPASKRREVIRRSLTRLKCPFRRIEPSLTSEEALVPQNILILSRTGCQTCRSLTASVSVRWRMDCIWLSIGTPRSRDSQWSVSSSSMRLKFNSQINAFSCPTTLMWRERSPTCPSSRPKPSQRRPNLRRKSKKRRSNRQATMKND